MRKRILGILLVTTMVFSLVGCGNNGTGAEVLEQTSEVESSTEVEVQASETESSVEVEAQASEVETEVAQEQSVAGDIKVALQEGKYDEAIGMLDEAKADMEVEEYALLMSNAYLYKEDYVAAADMLVEKIAETDSQVLKDRLEYIRANTIKLETLEYDQQGNMVYSTTYEYDDAGRLLKSIGLDASGDQTRNSEYEYEYDDKGNKIKEVYSLGNEKAWNSAFDNIYKEDGSLESVITYDEEGIILHIDDYDDFGNVIMRTMYNEGEVFSYYKYEYDESGRETSLEFGYATGEVQYKNTYEYKEVNGLIEKTCYDEEGNATAFLKMDKEGNVVYDDTTGLFILEYKFNSLNDRVYYSATGSGLDSVNDIEHTYKFIGNIEE